MINKKQLKIAYLSREWSAIDKFYDENLEFIEFLYDYIRLSNPDNVYLISKFKKYLNEEI